MLFKLLVQAPLQIQIQYQEFSIMYAPLKKIKVDLDMQIRFRDKHIRIR